MRDRPPALTDPLAEVPSLVVFSDDWGRHPSSCQHLVRELLPTRRVLWVNTIGTRTPKLDRATLLRATEKLRQWRSSRLRNQVASPGRNSQSSLAASQLMAPSLQKGGQERSLASCSHATGAPGGSLPSNLRVLNPRMWPWFTRRIDRRLNRLLLRLQLCREIERLPRPVVALTTLPITADLVGRLPVAGWLYYCVDDFSQWPGLDGRTLGRMEEDLVEKVDRIVAVSETLRARIARMGRSSHLLTHGCNVDHWSLCSPPSEGGAGGVAQIAPVPTHTCRFAAPLHAALNDLQPPWIVFWGVIDRRMDVAFVRRLSESLDSGTILLVGPSQDPDPALAQVPRVVCRPPVPFDELPQLAASASILVMPYADLPVTRAMQPLKLKEYLATGKPAVVRALPATRDWRDCLDEAHTPGVFAAIVRERLRTGLPESQRRARECLDDESWSAKASQLRRWLAQTLEASDPPPGDPSASRACGFASSAHLE